MSKHSFDNFVQKNSSSQSRRRALGLFPVLIASDANHFRFSCKGSSSKPYLVRISLHNGQIDTASCSCPYNYAGLCKHVIACIFKMIQFVPEPAIHKGEKPKLKNMNQNHKNNQIQLEKGLMNWEEIKTRYHAPYYNPHSYNIASFSKYKIRILNQDWQTFSQELIYNPENDLLTVNCSCRSGEAMCIHKMTALSKVIHQFGPNYFSPTFLEDQISEHLAQYHLTLADDYSELFDYELTQDGFVVHNKRGHIDRATAIVPDFENSTDEVASYLPLPCDLNSPLGLGFCFAIEKKEFYSFFPVKGKLNKSRSELSSSFEEISYFNFDQSLNWFESEDQQRLIVKTLQIDQLLQGELSLIDRAKALQLVKQITTAMQDYPIFTYQANKSLIRKNLDPITLDSSAIKLFFKLSEQESVYCLKAYLKVGEKNYKLSASKITVSPIFVKVDQNLHPIASADLSRDLAYYSNKPEIYFIKKDLEANFEKTLGALSKKYELQTTAFKKIAAFETLNLAKQVYIKDVNGIYIAFQPFVKYQNQLVPLDQPGDLWQLDQAEGVQKKVRNLDFEEQFKDEMTSLHPLFEDQEGIYYLSPKDLVHNQWLLGAIARMKQLNIEVFGASDLKSFKYNLNKPTISISLKSEVDWFDLDIQVSFGDQKAAMKDLKMAFIKKSHYVALDDGTLGILPEDWMQRFENYFKVGETHKKGLKLSNYHFGIIDALYEEMDEKPAFLQELYERNQRLKNLVNIPDIPLPKGVQATLRPYQQHGLNWLAFLEENQIGGCLADDMGLGKTLQTIAFLQYLKLRDKKQPPSLILAPTSLVFNWIAEVNRFCPSLKILSFTGSNRMDDRAHFNEYDLVISTYGSLLNDVESLSDFQFNYVILDESQAIKNANSKRYKAVRLLQARNRLILTGTPIENNTFDLYAQLNFINPGLLGNTNHFKTQFSDDIDKEKNADTAHLLNKLVAPFILRRTKEQVATELPDKTESILYCEMGSEQRKVYDYFKNKYKDYLLNKIDENGAAKSQMYILEGLTKLRQICNSTALLNEEQDFGMHAAKLELLIEQIKEKTGKHKILVFSQFVKMLHLIQNRLNDEGVAYEYLDGQTKNRQDRVNHFQNNEDIRVFLISLKAGGTGLNLTEADYVFIVDPWWNPAVENQAIDRCYRIGQTKNVFAYRMICKDSIEEKIVLLQQKKTKIASSIISVDEEKKSFNAEEVRELFS